MTSVWEIRSPEPGDAPVILPAGTTSGVHEKIVEGVALDREISVEPDEQITWEDGEAVTTGVGSTVTMTGKVRPWQPLETGVTM